MAEKNSLTPEKELLNLIEKPMSKRSLHVAAMKYHGLSLFSLAAIKGRFAFIKQRLRVYFAEGSFRQLDIRVLNNTLKLCAVILMVYFIFNLFLSTVNLKKGLRPGMKIDKFPAVSSSQITSLLKTASYYLEKARERNIFNMGTTVAVSKSNTVGKEISQRIIEATGDLRLVGIAWSDDPDIMIEDTKNKRTYFLKKGQMIDNGVKLQAVFKDKVILQYQGEEVELK
jgi:hypothetical protein